MILKEWKKELPCVSPYYAVKSFPDTTLIQFLASQQINFDCASRREIKMVKNLASNSDIIYANPIKSDLDLESAKRNDVDKIVIDSIEEVDKLVKSNLTNSNIIIRINSDETYSKIKFNSKFGCNLYEYEAINDYMMRHNMLIKGISFHVGSKCVNTQAYDTTLKSIFHNYFPINNNIEFIDIGGGMHDSMQLSDLGAIVKKYQKINPNIQYIAEPGRLFAESTVSLYTKVTGVKKRLRDDKEHFMVYINDSIYHSFSGKMFDGQAFAPTPLYHNPNIVCATIYGQTCDSLDVICSNIMIPEPSVDDVFMFDNMGAYAVAGCDDFNGFNKAIVTVNP